MRQIALFVRGLLSQGRGILAIRAFAKCAAFGTLFGILGSLLAAPIVGLSWSALLAGCISATIAVKILALAIAVVIADAEKAYPGVADHIFRGSSE